MVELDSQKLMVDGRFCLSVHFLPTVHFYPIWPSTLNLMRFWNLKSPWATPHSGRSNRSSNRSGVSSSAERTRNQLSPSCGSIAPKRRKGSFWNSPRTRVLYHMFTQKGWFFDEFVKRKTWGLKRTLCWNKWDRHEGFKYTFVLEFKIVRIHCETSIGYKYQKSRHEFYLHHFYRLRTSTWGQDLYI